MEDEKKPGCQQRVSNVIAGSLERFFFRYGQSVATHPFKYITVCVLVTATCCLGFLNLYTESRPEKLWIPQDTDYVKTLEWQSENFPNDQRVQLILFEADNVLRAEYVREMYRLKKEVRAIQVTDRYGRILTQEDLCFRIPALGGKVQEQLKHVKLQFFPDRDPDAPIDWSMELNKNLYYQFYSLMPTACLELGILEIWGDNDTLLAGLTDQDVVKGVNTATLSVTFHFLLNFTEFLGGIERDESGRIVVARSALTQIIMEVNRTDVGEGFMDNDAGLAEEVDMALYDWEGEFIRVVRNDSGRPQELGVFMQAQRSFGEISSETIVGDLGYLIAGVTLLYLYVQIMLGKFNMVETRPVLSVLGLLSVWMGVAVSYGLCSAFGILYGPVHSILPLLMLGLGVDDMFVVVQCWHNLGQEERRQELRNRMGSALRHAGVAITVTSLTDFAAFAIGATTVLPALRSFCIYSAVGIVALYVLQATFFVAWLTLDQRRLEDHRNGFVWCYKHKDWSPNPCSQRDLCQTFFDKVYSRYLLATPIKVLVLVATGVMMGLGIWGVTNLEHEFNPVWFIPQSSYLFQFFSRTLEYYPQAGERGTVYLGALDYPNEVYKVGELMEAMENNQYISSVDSWYHLMVAYTHASTGKDITGQQMNESYFGTVLSDFLFSQTGSRFQTYFHFAGNLSVGQPAPQVQASKFDFRHTRLDKADQIPAMDQTKELVNSANFSDFAAPIATQYSSWETDKIITKELMRNLILSLLAVLIMTLLLLANVLASFYVLICVALTLVDVMALMTWWDLTIDIISCIYLVLCVGLCVDYSVHIALHFLQVKGSKNERVRATLKDIGPPVINGAFSTFLAFILLANSDSHVFLSFFKIFFGVFVFGVFHGLTFLPVLLSLLGPAPYNSDRHDVHPTPSDITLSTTLDTKTIDVAGYTYTQAPSAANS